MSTFITSHRKEYVPITIIYRAYGPAVNVKIKYVIMMEKMRSEFSRYLL